MVCLQTLADVQHRGFRPTGTARGGQLAKGAARSGPSSHLAIGGPRAKVVEWLLLWRPRAKAVTAPSGPFEVIATEWRQLPAGGASHRTAAPCSL